MTQEQFELVNHYTLVIALEEEAGGPAHAIDEAIDEGSEKRKLGAAMNAFRERYGQEKLEIYMFYALYPGLYAGISQERVWELFNKAVPAEERELLSKWRMM